MVDEDVLKKVYRAINNKQMRFILKTINEDKAMTYSEILQTMKDCNLTKDSSKIAYYVRHLRNANMLTIDDCTKKYILSRIGIQSLDVITNFEKICKTYDMSDVDANGRIEFEYKIVGRKLWKQMQYVQVD